MYRVKKNLILIQEPKLLWNEEKNKLIKSYSRFYKAKSDRKTTAPDLYDHENYKVLTYLKIDNHENDFELQNMEWDDSIIVDDDDDDFYEDIEIIDQNDGLARKFGCTCLLLFKFFG